jgi:hypothetical protein
MCQPFMSHTDVYSTVVTGLTHATISTMSGEKCLNSSSIEALMADQKKTLITSRLELYDPGDDLTFRVLFFSVYLRRWMYTDKVLYMATCRYISKRCNNLM